MSSTPGGQDRPHRHEALAQLAAAAVMCWCLLPPHQRQAAAMAALAAARRCAARAAAACGRQAMAAELATGAQRYGVPYALSLARERLTAAYERLRAGVTA